MQLFAILSVVGATAGCLGPQRSDYESSWPIRIADPSEQADQLWGAVQDTLRRHRFRLDRVDRRAGLVSTMPEISQHFFEFWRHDVDTRMDRWEATLNPIRRWVEVTVAREEDQAMWDRLSSQSREWNELNVTVHKERLSSPDRQFNSTGAAYQYFGDSLPSTTGMARVTAADETWLDQGRDPAMEDRLLRAILERAELETAPDRTTPR